MALKLVGDDFQGVGVGTGALEANAAQSRYGVNGGIDLGSALHPFTQDVLNVTQAGFTHEGVLLTPHPAAAKPEINDGTASLAFSAAPLYFLGAGLSPNSSDAFPSTTTLFL